MSGKLNSELPRIVLTMGDPSGIGPEIIAKALADPEMKPLARWVVAGDAAVLERAGNITGAPLDGVEVVHVPALDKSPGDFAFGRLEARYGNAAVEYVRAGTEMC